MKKDTHRNFQAFFKGLEDKTAQDILLTDPNTDSAVKEIILLARDKKFLKKAENVVSLLKQQHAETNQWSGTFSEFAKAKNSDTSSTLKDTSDDIREYVLKKYPEGVKLLGDYGKLAQQENYMGGVGAWTNVAAYAEALVNAAVYANVAIATNVAVAAAAVAVIAAVVA
jgi:hypothetical protein